MNRIRRWTCLLACALALCLGRSVVWGVEKLPKPSFSLFDPGQEANPDYDKYGVFTGVGTEQYRYLISDREGLSRAVGEGIYPNVNGLLKDPWYQKAQYGGLMEGNVWDFVNTDDTQMNFYKWASSHEQPGVKQFYIAGMLERSGLISQAIKAYYACVVHFPKTYGTTYWKTPWYIGPTALDSVAYLTRHYPELKLHLRGGRVRIVNGFDDDTHNDHFEIDPGKLETVAEPPKPEVHDLTNASVQRRLGGKATEARQYAGGDWQLFVDNKPYILKAVSYSPTPVGKSPDDGSWVQHRDWMLADQNKNGKIDGPYDSWVDKNRNDKQDADEPVVGDFQLLKEMGANTIRLYHHGFNKELLRDLYHTYGIRVIMGDYLGAYTIGSGAEWYAGTNYSDPAQQKKMLDSVRQMVEEYKDEPYVVFWMLGNENNFGNQNNSRQNPDAYYQFVNKAARMIKSIDPSRPVALCNGEIGFMDKIARYGKDVDFLGINAYRGNHGFGDSFWKNLSEIWGKPAFVSEFGCPAYHRRKSPAEAEKLQADYLRSNWEDIEYNLAGGPGMGNALGGVLFEWLDEWWKAGPPPQYDASIHDTAGQFQGPFPDGWSYEEWYGVVSQGNGKNSPFERQLRKSYFLFKDELWKK